MPRHAAYLALRTPNAKPLLAVDHVARERNLDERDTALVRRLVGMEIRRRATLRAIVAAFTHHKPKTELATFLRLGIAQILYFDKVPPHAAVSETVRASADFLGLSKGRIVNGVLRTVLRSVLPGSSGDPTRDIVSANVHFDGPVFRDPELHPHLWAEDALSIPGALHKRWVQRYGEDEARALAMLALEESPVSMRVRGDREAVQTELRDLDVESFHGAHPAILVAASEHVGAVVRSAPFVEGRITVQGEHAARAAGMVGDVKGKTVLDMCAAPGGKSAAIADGAPSVLVSIDLSARRLSRAYSTFDRLRLGAPMLAAMDGTSGLSETIRFDAVFIDAPCSNTGVLAQRPAARWRYGPKTQKELGALQLELLRAGASKVAGGGVLVHSTCSLEPEENEQVVKAFLGQAPGWSLEEEIRTLPRPLEGGGPVDGGYAARLRAPR